MWDDAERASVWSSPIVLTLKIDALRFFVSFINLNNIYVMESSPSAILQAFIGSLKYAKVFSTLDGNARYWEVALDERDKVNTACVAYFELYM